MCSKQLMHVASEKFTPHKVFYATEQKPCDTAKDVLRALPNVNCQRVSAAVLLHACIMKKAQDTENQAQYMATKLIKLPETTEAKLLVPKTVLPLHKIYLTCVNANTYANAAIISLLPHNVIWLFHINLCPNDKMGNRTCI